MNIKLDDKFRIVDGYGTSCVLEEDTGRTTIPKGKTEEEVVYKARGYYSNPEQALEKYIRIKAIETIPNPATFQDYLDALKEVKKEMQEVFDLLK